MSEGLHSLFAATGIGSGANPMNPDLPQASEPAWRSYRLKGTQTQFYNRDGYATIVGASITERLRKHRVLTELSCAGVGQCPGGAPRGSGSGRQGATQYYNLLRQLDSYGFPTIFMNRVMSTNLYSADISGNLHP